MQRVFDFLDTKRIASGGTGIAVSAAGMAGTPIPRLPDMIECATLTRKSAKTQCHGWVL